MQWRQQHATVVAADILKPTLTTDCQRINQALTQARKQEVNGIAWVIPQI